MSYLLVPITGSGKEGDNFRPQLSALLSAAPGFRYTAHIPTDKDGQPLFTDCYIWVPDAVDLSLTGITTTTKSVATSDMKTREPDVNFGAMELLP